MSERVIDEVDTKILRDLIKDIRVSFTSIAKNCGLSTVAITKRYKKLKRKGVIIDTRVLFNHKFTGFTCLAYLGINADHIHIQKIVEALKKNPNTWLCFECIGRFDIQVLVAAKNLEHLDQVTEEIKKLQGVKTIATNICVDKKITFHLENLLVQQGDMAKVG